MIQSRLTHSRGVIKNMAITTLEDPRDFAPINGKRILHMGIGGDSIDFFLDDGSTLHVAHKNFPSAMDDATLVFQLADADTMKEWGERCKE